MNSNRFGRFLCSISKYYVSVKFSVFSFNYSERSGQLKFMVNQFVFSFTVILD